MLLTRMLRQHFGAAEEEDEAGDKQPDAGTNAAISEAPWGGDEEEDEPQAGSDAD